MKKFSRVLSLALAVVLAFGLVSVAAPLSARADGIAYFELVNMVDDSAGIPLNATNSSDVSITVTCDGSNYFWSDTTIGYITSGTHKLAYLFFPLDKPCTMVIEATFGTHRFSKTLNLAANTFVAGTARAISLTEADLLPEPEPFTAYVKLVDDAGDPMPNCEIGISRGYGIAEFKAVTDANGIAAVESMEYDLIAAGKTAETAFYFVGPLNGVNWTISNPDPSMAQLTATTYASPWTVTAPASMTENPIISGITLTVDTYLGSDTATGTLLQHEEQTDNVFRENTTVLLSSRVRMEGVADCTGAAVTVNGEPYTSELRYTSGSDSAYLAMSCSGLSANDEVHIDFFYEYNDADKEYTVKIYHDYYADSTMASTSFIYAPPPTTIKAKPGEAVNASARTTAAAPYCTEPNAPGCADGVFILAGKTVAGGGGQIILGSFPDTDTVLTAYSVSATMIHADCEIHFLYSYSPDMMLTFANLDGDGAPATEEPFTERRVSKGTTVTLPETVPERDGYVFVGWIDPNGTDVLAPGDSFEMPARPVALYAQWFTQRVEVTTDIDDDRVEVVGLDAAALNFLEAETVLGHHVMALEMDVNMAIKSRQVVVETSQIPVEQREIEALADGREILYYDVTIVRTVTYLVNNGSGWVIAEGYYEYDPATGAETFVPSTEAQPVTDTGDTIAVTLPLPEGDLIDLEVYRFHAPDPADPETGDAITFELDDGGDYSAQDEYWTENDDSITVHARYFSTYGIGYRLYVPTPPPPPGPPTPPPPTYKVTYETNGGTEIPQETHNAGDIILLDLAPTREGFSFTGWFADAELTSPITEITVTADVTVYAGWQHTGVPGALVGGTHFAYIVGYPDGLVHPTDYISRSQVAVIFYRLLDPAVREQYYTTECAFEDVASGEWYASAVATLAAMGAIHGYDPTHFAPSNCITRAEFATICAFFAPEPAAELRTFPDVEGHWAESAVCKAASCGWILGNDEGLFKPNDYITRAEVMALLNRVLQRLPAAPDDLLDGMIEWSDNADTAAWYYLPVQEATNSHAFGWDGDGEYWTALTEGPDWSAIG